MTLLLSVLASVYPLEALNTDATYEQAEISANLDAVDPSAPETAKIGNIDSHAVRAPTGDPPALTRWLTTARPCLVRARRGGALQARTAHARPHVLVRPDSPTAAPA